MHFCTKLEKVVPIFYIYAKWLYMFLWCFSCSEFDLIYSWILSCEENNLSFQTEILTKFRSEKVLVTDSSLFVHWPWMHCRVCRCRVTWRRAPGPPSRPASSGRSRTRTISELSWNEINISGRGHNIISIPQRILWASITPNSSVSGIDIPSKQWWTPTLQQLSSSFQRCLAFTSFQQSWALTQDGTGQDEGLSA